MTSHTSFNLDLIFMVKKLSEEKMNICEKLSHASSFPKNCHTMTHYIWSVVDLDEYFSVCYISSDIGRTIMIK